VNHADHVALLARGVTQGEGGTWADLGSGTGAFTLALVRGYLKHGGRLLLVEYDSDRGNTWVPHPMSFDTWRDVAAEAGFVETRKLATVPSRFLHTIYSALSLAP